MNDPNEHALRKRFERLAPADDSADWRDVQRRARALGRRRRIGVGAASAAIALVGALATPGLGLGERIVGLFRDEGEPVPISQLTRRDREFLTVRLCRHVELVTRPGRRPGKRCTADGTPRIEQVASDGSRFYWKVSYSDGRVCLASGPVRGFRDRLRGDSQIGTLSCTEKPASARQFFPRPGRPITVDAAMSLRPGDALVRLLGVSGLAGEGVSSVGLVARDGSTTKTRVVDRAYTFAEIPEREWVAIVAYDGSDEEVYRERALASPFAPSRASTAPDEARPAAAGAVSGATTAPAGSRQRRRDPQARARDLPAPAR